MEDEKKEDAENPPQPSEEKSEGTEQKPQSEPFDYKAELDKIKQEQEKQNSNINYRLRQLEKGGKSDEEPVDPEPAKESVEELVKKEASKLFATQTEAQARMFARQIAGNQDEADLIIYHYKNTLSLTGDVEKDIRRAKLIANEGRIEKEREQIRKANQAQQTMGNAGGEGGQKTEEDKINLDKTNQEFLISQGFKRDSKRHGWISPRGRFVSDAEMRGTRV